MRVAPLLSRPNRALPSIRSIPYPRSNRPSVSRARGGEACACRRTRVRQALRGDRLPLPSTVRMPVSRCSIVRQVAMQRLARRRRVRVVRRARTTRAVSPRMASAWTSNLKGKSKSVACPARNSVRKLEPRARRTARSPGSSAARISSPTLRRVRALPCTRGRWARNTVKLPACRIRKARRLRQRGASHWVPSPRSSRRRGSSRARPSPCALCCRAFSCTRLRSSITMPCASATSWLPSTRRWRSATAFSKATSRRCRPTPASKIARTSSSVG